MITFKINNLIELSRLSRAYLEGELKLDRKITWKY